MKCLVIHGSPRQGNTWNVLNIAKEEMQKNGDFDFEVIELAKEKIPTCIGCFNSPVYSLQVSGLLKNFIDHMSYNFHRPKFYKKRC